MCGEHGHLNEDAKREGAKVESTVPEIVVKPTDTPVFNHDAVTMHDALGIRSMKEKYIKGISEGLEISNNGHGGRGSRTSEVIVHVTTALKKEIDGGEITVMDVMMFLAGMDVQKAKGGSNSLVEMLMSKMGGMPGMGM